MDIASLVGVILGLLAVFGGAALEGLHLTALVQPTAAIIVAGGTLAATLVSFPQKAIVQAVKDLTKIFVTPKEDSEAVIKSMVNLAKKARNSGIISLEQEAAAIKDPFIKKGISLVVDGVEPEIARQMMESEINCYEEHNKVSAEVFACAGGYSPTIGIIGAVLGLIHVMNNLSDTSKLGGGIAVAFVATIYGLMIANLFCIPFGTKITQRVKQAVLQKEMTVEGLIAIQNGESPMLIEQRLRGFLQH